MSASDEVDVSTPASRRLRRLQRTHETHERATHRRRTVFARTGVLGGFALAMVVYPVMGTVTPYADAVDSVPEAVAGDVPSTVEALLGAGPSLVETELPLPEADVSSVAMLVDYDYTVSQHLPECDPTVGWSGSNGRLSADSLCTLWNGEQLRADAAVALAELNHRFSLKFGRDLCIGEGYRNLSKQYAIKQSRGYLAATPGTSVHGWGLAFDLCGGDDSGAAKAWLEANGPAWGWVNPAWAKASKWEPWHWEYVPGTDDLNVYGSGSWTSDGSNSSGG